MVKRKQGERVPRWSDTPLDHWSEDVDPSIMAGDEWADDTVDPGAQAVKEKQTNRPPAPFMHPMHDSNYGLEDDRFVEEDKNP